jgi:uncharacterized protein YqjF (DUF2071 family)
VNIHHWDRISFLHWPVPPAELAHLVPAGAEVLTYEGTAWVTVTPFVIRVRPPGSPVTPPGWTFPETNLRTYITGPGGRQGLWFLRMEVTALWFVATLRALGLPYVRQPMNVHLDDVSVVYESGRARAASQGGHHVVVRPGERLDPPEGGPFERFVTARWGAFHTVAGRLLHTPVEHEPWRLCAADIESCSVDSLFRAAGLPPPANAPVAQFSPGVRVRVGLPRLVR